MWLNDLENAIKRLYKRYGLNCCVESIKDNVVTMTNHEVYTIDYILSDEWFEYD